jgi:hypothetical protein
MYKKLFLLLFIQLINHQIFSQNNVLETIYLKNGSIVKGMIVEIVPNVSYTVKSAEGSIYVCAISEIIKIVREPLEIESVKAEPVIQKIGQQPKGYEGLVELGYGGASGIYGLDVIKINFVNGYRFNPYYFAGFGFGMRNYFDHKTITIPFFVDFRAQFYHKNLCPYVSIAGGGALNTNDDFFGTLVNPSLGIKLNTKKNIIYQFSIGYDAQQIRFLKIVGSPWDPQIFHTIQFSESATINLGITF